MDNKGFTIIELAVVVFIIVLLLALTLPNYRSGNRQLSLQRSIHKLAQDLRRAQEMALSVKEFEGSLPHGYGFYADLDEPTKYILFADLDDNQEYSGVSEKVEETFLEKGIEISKLSPIAPDFSLNIVFLPPDPTILFSPDDTLALIALQAEGLTMLVPQYTYQIYDWWDWGWQTPRASCDTSQWLPECPSSFSADESDPMTIYDQWRLIFKFSKKYQKEEGQISVPLQRTVYVNKAGLIAIMEQ